MHDAARHSTIDLLAAARALPCLASLALLAAGAAAGWTVAAARGARHEAAIAWSLPSFSCPVIPGAQPAREFDGFRLAATAVEGLGVRPATVPSRLDGSLLRCEVEERTGAATLRCTAESDDPLEARRLAVLADARMRDRDSPLSHAVAEARILGACGRPWIEAQGREPTGDAAVHNVLPPTAPLLSLREAIAGPATLLAQANRVATVPRSRPAAAFLGLAAGAIAALLFAAWRVRRPEPPDEAPRQESRLATTALAGLMLTASMDTVLALDLGPFTLRLGQLCALALLAALLAPRLRAGSAAFPAKAVLASLLYMLVAATSALWSDNPLKSAGYLAWAGFDLLAVFVGIALYADTERRFELALRLWFAGLLLAAAMGGLQLGLWAATGSAPLLYYDGHGLPRLNAFSYEPSYFALYLVPGALVLLARFALLGRRNWEEGLLAGLLLVTVGLSTSRSGWLGAGIGVGAVVLLALRRLGRKALPRLLATGGAIALAAALSLACWPQLRASTARLARMALDRNELSSSRPRLDSMVQAARLVQRHPVLGVGFGGYGASVDRHPELQRLEGKQTHAVVTTNLWLELAAETGALGLLAAVAMLLSLLWPLGLRREAPTGPALAAARAGLVAAALTAFLVLFQFSQTLWRLDIWVLLGLCFAAALTGRKDSRVPQRADCGTAPANGARPIDQHAHRP